MLGPLRAHLDFIVTFIFPFLVLVGDTLVKIGLKINWEDVGSDMTLCIITIFLTLLIEDMRIIFSQSSTKELIRDHKDIVIMIIAVVFFGCIWFLSLMIGAESSQLYQFFPLLAIYRPTMALSIGISSTLAASRLLYDLLTPHN